MHAPRVAFEEACRRVAAALDEPPQVPAYGILGPAFIDPQAVVSAGGAGRTSVAERQPPCTLAAAGVADVDIEQGRGVDAEAGACMPGIEPWKRSVHFHRQGCNVPDSGIRRGALGNGGVLNVGLFRSKIYGARCIGRLGHFADIQFSVSDEGDLKAVLCHGIGGQALARQGHEDQ